MLACRLDRSSGPDRLCVTRSCLSCLVLPSDRDMTDRFRKPLMPSGCVDADQRFSLSRDDRDPAGQIQPSIFLTNVASREDSSRTRRMPRLSGARPSASSFRNSPTPTRSSAVTSLHARQCVGETSILCRVFDATHPVRIRRQGKIRACGPSRSRTASSRSRLKGAVAIGCHMNVLKDCRIARKIESLPADAKVSRSHILQRLQFYDLDAAQAWQPDDTLEPELREDP